MGTCGHVLADHHSDLRITLYDDEELFDDDDEDIFEKKQHAQYETRKALKEELSLLLLLLLLENNFVLMIIHGRILVMMTDAKMNTVMRLRKTRMKFPINPPLKYFTKRSVPKEICKSDKE